jgi:hypothetical protein
MALETATRYVALPLLACRYSTSAGSAFLPPGPPQEEARKPERI